MYKIGDKVWFYTYDSGLRKVSIIKIEENNVILENEDILPPDLPLRVPKKDISFSKERIELLAFAVNYKKGWLKRDIDRSIEDNDIEQIKYHRKMMDLSIKEFPELWV